MVMRVRCYICKREVDKKETVWWNLNRFIYVCYNCYKENPNYLDMVIRDGYAIDKVKYYRCSICKRHIYYYIRI